MRTTDDQIGLGKHLARRLHPLTLAIGFLISIGLPATYYALESSALRRTATIYAQALSEKLQDLVLDAPALWKYQTYKYGQILGDLISRKDVTFIRVLDEAGRPVTGYEHTTAKAEAWWNRYAPRGSAPILFNNRQIGTVQVGVTQGPLLGVTLALLLFSTTVGVGLAVLVYVYPVSVVTEMEEERERLRAASQASEERCRDLVQGLDAIVWEADAETFQFSFVSRQAEAVLGYPVECWLEDPGFCAGIIHPEDRERIVSSCQTATAEGRDHQFEYRVVAADGRVVWIRNLVRVVRDADGRAQQLRGVMVDITQLKEAEEALAVTNRSLEAKNQELEAFVYTVTHDLRAPLVALQGMASMLAEAKGVQLDAEGRHYLDRLVANTAHMEELIRNLLEFSRVGRLAKPPEAVAVAEVVDCLLLQWGDLIREKGIKVICRDLPVLWGERTRIEQIYQNLIGNALKFLGSENLSPMVEVGAEDRGEEWECYVKDNGIGIDPAYHGKVFELFQRLREVEAEGTGIGLAIAKKIVDRAGGTMWIESEAGKGATFRFTWPKDVGEGSGRNHE